MPISLVGTAQANSALNGANVTLTFSTVPQSGDVVFFYGGYPFRAGSPPAGPTNTGYKLIASNSANTPHWGVWYKVLSGSTDTTVTGVGSGNASDATAYGAYVLRGTDTGSLFSATATTAGPTAAVPNGPAITTADANAWVITHAGAAVNDTSRGTVTGYTILTGASGNDTVDISTEAAYSASVNPITADPPAWSTWTSSTYYAVTIAVKELVVTGSIAKMLRWIDDDY